MRRNTGDCAGTLAASTLTALLATGCAASAKPAATLPVQQPKASTPPEGGAAPVRSLGPRDPCALLSASEIATISGLEVGAPVATDLGERMHDPSAGSQCRYASKKDRDAFVQITVASLRDGARNFVGLRDVYERLAERGEAERISDLPLPAYFARNRDFVVLFTDAEVVLNVMLTDASYDWADGIDKTAEKSVAKKLVTRFLDHARAPE
jgi:hypothetical protein